MRSRSIADFLFTQGQPDEDYWRPWAGALGVGDWLAIALAGPRRTILMR